MAIRLHEGELQTPNTAIFDGARKAFVSCRFRISADSDPSKGGSVITRVFDATFSISVSGGASSNATRSIQARWMMTGWGNVVVPVTGMVANHFLLAYDADDPDAQGFYVNGIFTPTTAPTSTSIPASVRGLRIKPSGGDHAIEELVVGIGVLPTMEQVRALGELDSSTIGAEGVIAELLGESGSTVHRWTMRGTPGDPAGVEDDAGTVAVGSSSLKLTASVGPVPYLDDMDPVEAAHFGQPTIMSSGRAVDIPMFTETEAGSIPAAPLATNPSLKPTFRVNGGEPIEPIAIVGKDKNYDGLLCLLPPGTTIGPDDAVTWSAPYGWAVSEMGASPEVIDQPCRNRVGKTSYEAPADQPPMRVGVNIDIPGPKYYAPFRIQKNRGLQTNAGSLGGDLQWRRDNGRGTLNSPTTMLFDDGKMGSKRGFPTRLGCYLLAWTDNGTSSENDDLPCGFQINPRSYGPDFVKLARDRDITLENGSVRKLRAYESKRRAVPVTLAEAIDADATEIKISTFGSLGLPSSDFDYKLELDGETITASGRISNPPTLTNCVRGVKGTAKSHAMGAAGTLGDTQWAAIPALVLTGTAGKVNYSDLTILGPDDWELPPEGEPLPDIRVDNLDLSAEFERWSANGLGILRVMGSTPVGHVVVEPEHIHDPTDAMWGLPLGENKMVATGIRQFTPGADKWVYLRHNAPNSLTYPVTLLQPLEAVAQGTIETIEVEGTESNPVMLGSRLLVGDETIRVISGSDTTWTVERGAGLTTPEAAEAGEIQAGWRFPLTAYVDPSGTTPEDGDGGPPPEGEPEPDPEEGSGGETGGAIDVPAGPVHFEFTCDEPHSMGTMRRFDATGDPSYTATVNITARRTGTLTADIDADDTVIPVAFAEEDWPWIAPGLKMLIANEVMTIDSVDKEAGTVTLEIPTSGPARTNAAPRTAGTTITTRSNGFLCESLDGTMRAWQGLLRYSYQLCVTGPKSIYLSRTPETRRACVKVVPGQQLDNYTNKIPAPEASFPFELCVKAAEHANAWLIVNIAGFSTDDYAIAVARRILAASEPGKTKFAIEYANEIWNQAYPYYEPYDRFAKWGGLNGTTEYTALRSWRVFSLFKTIFDEAGRGDELIHFMPWQRGGAGTMLGWFRSTGVDLDATGCGPYTAPVTTDDLVAWINASDDDGPVCDAWVFAFARYIGSNSIRVGLEKDRASVELHESLTGRPLKVIHYEGGLAHTVPPTGDVIQARERNQDVRYHPCWYFAERDWYSLIARFTRGEAIAVFNCAQPPYDPARHPGSVDHLWGMNAWKDQRAGYGDGRDGGIDNTSIMHRQGLPNSATAVDNPDLRDSVRWQAALDYNQAFFTGVEPDPGGEDPDPGGEDPDPEVPDEIMGLEYQHANNALGVVEDGFTRPVGGATIRLKPGQAASFGSPTPEAPVRASTHRRNPSPESDFDVYIPGPVFRCEGVIGDSLLVTDVIEGTTDAEILPGDVVLNTITKGDMDAIKAAVIAAAETGGSGGTGTKGDPGEKGDKGDPGSVWRNGSGSPSDSLGVDGDYYLDNDTGDVHLKTAGSYAIVANIKGPKGDQGEPGEPGESIKGDPGNDGANGADGSDGTPGSVWRDGSGTPSSSLGVDGDYYLDNDTGDVHLRSSGVYAIVANIKGPKGDQGDPGSDGADGADGADGTPGNLWRTGSGAPSNAVGIDGDLYINTSTADVYQRSSGTYSVALNIKGPKGDQGDPGGSGGGSGTVTSVGLSMPSGFSVSGSPVTTSGTLAVTTNLSGLVMAVDGGFVNATAGVNYVTPTQLADAISEIELTPGEKGDQGETGPAGDPGTVWRSGATVPSNSLGIDGDYYLNTATGDVYLRSSGLYGQVANITGPAGSDGADGSDGTNGTDGADGATITSGSGAPSGGADGDHYVRTDTWDVYKRASGSWSVIGNIKGAQGEPGADGSDGSDGAPGSVWRDGSGSPSGGLGIDGDYYIDATTADVYHKSAGSYSVVLNIKGPKGDTGDSGGGGSLAIGADVEDGVAGRVLFVNGTGKLAQDSTFTFAAGSLGAPAVSLVAASASDVPLKVRQATSQTGDLLQLLSSGGSPLTAFDASGNGFVERQSFRFLGEIEDGDQGDDAGSVALYPGKLSKLVVTLKTNPVGGGFKLQIKRNGVDLFASPVSIPANTTTTQIFTSFVSTTVNEGDVFTPHVSDAGTGVSGVLAVLGSLVRNR